MKTQLIVAAGLAALTLAACNRNEPAQDETMSATDATADASTSAPASTGAMAAGDRASSGATGSGAMPPPAETLAPMPVEQPGAAPAGGTTPGYNIGEAAQSERGPRPTIPADSTGKTAPMRTN